MMSHLIKIYAVGKFSFFCLFYDLRQKCRISSVDTAQAAGRVAQLVGHLTHKSGYLVRYLVWQHTFVSPSAFSRRAVVSYWQKYVQEVLVNSFGGLSLPRKSVVRLTDTPDIYRGHKTTIQQHPYIYKGWCYRISSVIRQSFFPSRTIPKI